MKDKNGFKKPSIDVCRERVKQYATQTINLEKHFDWSMDGVFLDLLVTEYVNLKIPEFVERYEFIINNQEKQSDWYGDIDTTINKLKVVGKNHNHEHWKDLYEFKLSGIFVLDNCSCAEDTKWVIIKEEKNPYKKGKELKDLTDEQIKRHFPIEVSYHLRIVKKIFKDEIDISKILTYGDLRDTGYIASFVFDKYDQKWGVKDNRGMLNWFDKFKHLTQNINTAHYGLTEKLKEKNEG
jgi:hypothetical protein